MTPIVQHLIERLERLPAAEQEKYGARWLGELLGGAGDGATMLEPGNRAPISSDAIKHHLGVFDGGPADLSTNPSYMDGFGEQK
jgi:hypothetical protein